MKLAFVACALVACIPIYKVDGTSASSLKPDDDHLDLAMSPRDAAQAVIEKLGARGFTVTDAQTTSTGYTVKLGGNRDFSGAMTIGSVFYVWVDGDGSVSHVRLLGKPTVDHAESCPSVDGGTCKTIKLWASFGISGYEEAVVIHGVLSELRLDGAAAATQTAQADELGHLTLHGCGRP